MSRSKNPVRETAESFICVNCGATVPPTEHGTANRNHCPRCLHSLHLDLRPGDRRSGCRGLMVPISVWVRANGEWSLLHRCERCGFIRANRIAGDDSEATLLALAAQPLARLPFPLEVLLGLAPSGGPGGPGGSGGPGGPGGPGGCTGVRGTSSTSNTSSQATTNESRKPR